MREKTSSRLSDEELVRLAVAGRGGEAGEGAAGALLDRYLDRVYIWCFRSLREREAALDAAQEVLINAYQKLESFEGRSSFASWLFVIARNRCCSVQRRFSPFVAADDELEEIPDPSPDPRERFERKLDEDAMLDLVTRSLDPIEQDAIWLRCYQELPVDEITRLLKLDSASGARGVLQRARRKLRAALDSTSGRSWEESGVPS